MTDNTLITARATAEHITINQTDTAPEDGMQIGSFGPGMKINKTVAVHLAKLLQEFANGDVSVGARFVISHDQLLRGDIATERVVQTTSFGKRND